MVAEVLVDHLADAQPVGADGLDRDDLGVEALVDVGPADHAEQSEERDDDDREFSATRCRHTPSLPSTGTVWRGHDDSGRSSMRRGMRVCDDQCMVTGYGGTYRATVVDDADPMQQYRLLVLVPDVHGDTRLSGLWR